MTDTLDPPVPPVSGPPAGGGDRVEPVDIQQEMQRSYIDYAMSVIVGRALPLVEDGLKPVHRRVLYSMGENGFRPDRSFVKCARVVGEVMGNYHPHGDSSIYDALVRLAQPWSMRYPLIDGQGNFGSRGNDPPAAMRYCVVGDSRVRMADGSSLRIGDIVPAAAAAIPTTRSTSRCSTAAVTPCGLRCCSTPASTRRCACLRSRATS